MEYPQILWAEDIMEYFCKILSELIFPALSEIWRKHVNRTWGFILTLLWRLAENGPGPVLEGALFATAKRVSLQVLCLFWIIEFSFIIEVRAIFLPWSHACQTLTTIRYEEAKANGKENYDRDLEDCLEKHIIECDRKIQRALKRLEDDDAGAATAIAVSEVTKVCVTNHFYFLISH